MKKSLKDRISVAGYYFKNTFRYWRITFKLMFTYNSGKWSEITVEELLDRINSTHPPLILDIRPPLEFAEGHIENAWSIPITDLARSEDLLPYKDKEIVTICPGGGLSLAAVDVLVKKGFTDVKSLRDGMDLWVEKGYPTTVAEKIESVGTSKKFEPIPLVDAKSPLEVHFTVDARNLTCPQPVLKSMKAIKALDIEQVLEVLVTDPRTDIASWARSSGHELLVAEERAPEDFRFLIKRMK